MLTSHQVNCKFYRHDLMGDRGQWLHAAGMNLRDHNCRFNVKLQTRAKNNGLILLKEFSHFN